jgi:hypothetical protein
MSHCGPSLSAPSRQFVAQTTARGRFSSAVAVQRSAQVAHLNDALAIRSADRGKYVQHFGEISRQCECPWPWLTSGANCVPGLPYSLTKCCGTVRETSWPRVQGKQSVCWGIGLHRCSHALICAHLRTWRRGIRGSSGGPLRVQHKVRILCRAVLPVAHESDWTGDLHLAGPGPRSADWLQLIAEKRVKRFGAYVKRKQ